MKIVALAGGVGGAKLADGLAGCLPPADLTIVVNTGDDFEHWGLNISPDLDTVCYTLANLANHETGWGRAEESWEVFESVTRLGGDDWFHIGDRDLATHLERTRRLKAGQPLSQITREFCRSWGIAPTVLPMTDDTVSTIVDTYQAGRLPFQEYFVHQRCEPVVKGFIFSGIESSRPAPGVLDAIRAADAIILCPSNPWVSIDPILKIDGVSAALSAKRVLAVSPIIQGQTIKGPAAKMFSELGIEPSALAVASHYKDLLSHFVIDLQDAGLKNQVTSFGIRNLAVNTVMKSRQDRIQLAKDVLNFLLKE